MLRSFREIRKELHMRRGKEKRLRDEEGRVIVDLRVKDDSDFLSPYSAENHNVLSEGVSDFIERSLHSVPAEEHIRLRIHSDEITAEEQKEYTAAIHDHYADCYTNAEREKKRLRRIAWFMALVGILALTVMIGLDVTGHKTAVALEVIDIFAWVFLWEAVDIFFLQCMALRIKQKRYLALVGCIVEYLPLEDERKK